MQQHNKNLILSIVTKLFTFALSYAINLSLAKYLHPSLYGDFILVLRVVTFSSAVALLGTDLGCRRFLTEYLLQQDTLHFKGYLRWSMVTIAIGALLIFALSTILMAIIFVLDMHHIVLLNYWHPLIYSLWLIPLFMLSIFLASILNSIGQFALYLVPISIVKQFVFLVFINLFGMLIYHLNLYYMVFAFAIQLMVVIVIQLVSLYYTYPKLPNHTGERVKKSWLRKTVPMMIGRITKQSLLAVNIVMLEVLTHSEHEVGLFAAMLTISSSVWVINSIFYPILSPLILPLLQSNQCEKLQKIIRSQNGVKTAILVIVNFVVIFFGKDLLSHFGPAYLSSYGPMILLTFAFDFLVLTHSARLILVYNNKQMLATKLQFVQLFITVGLNFILIPDFKLYGVALATLISSMIIAIATVKLAKKHSGIGLFYC